MRVCDVQAIYITMQGVLLHMYVLCEYSVRNKSPKSLQVVQAVCVCVRVCVCVCVHTGVYICAHVRFVKSVRNKNPTLLQVVQAQSVCVCVCVYVCVWRGRVCVCKGTVQGGKIMTKSRGKEARL